MDWKAAIETNRQALKRVLVTLVALAGITGGNNADRTTTLPRHLHRAVLRLLRPAEAAARRLVIVAARDMDPPPTRKATQPAPVAHRKPVAHPGTPPKTPARTMTLPLFDPLPRWRGRRRPAALGVPRIRVPGFSAPSIVALRRPPRADDPIDAARLALRLQALGRALDDLPAHARRFARWRANRDAISAQNRNHGAALDPPFCGKGRQAIGGERRIARRGAGGRRVWPLRPGRPPGARSRPTHEVHDALATLHGLALWAMEPPDTS
ncbi:hypothetical protein [Mesorhizobium sp. CAU 1732]|uniref:hypothetical protein n=1 Tax=Mesorhizobium sp. CAU 1732 TaxID=3140358 RepID=UPI00326086AC